MIDVGTAQKRILALSAPLPMEMAELENCIGRYLSDDLISKRTQPPADLSAMDGYAIRFANMPGPWQLTGESAAGAPFSGTVNDGEAIRIFTGAHVPDGADSILVQEDVEATKNKITLTGDGPPHKGAHIRPEGSDFAQGQILLHRGQTMNAGAIAVAAMGGYGVVPVRKIPKIAIIASGNELTPPGATCSSSKIPSSNNVMLRALLASQQCEIIDAGIVPDTMDALQSAFLNCGDADIIVTSGGASVGDHDLVRPALLTAGAKIEFWRVALRPGKPLMAGKLDQAVVLGLPGNPSSAFVTGFLFLLPLVRQLAGKSNPGARVFHGKLKGGLPVNGSRAQYLRAIHDGTMVHPITAQDSGMVTPLSDANALIIRAPYASAAQDGDDIPYHLLSTI